MNNNRKPVSAASEILRCGLKTAVGTVALAMLLPSSALAVDSTPKPTFEAG